MHFQNLHHIFNILNKKMTLIAYVFPKLQTAKDVVRQMPKRAHFRISFGNKHVTGSQILVKSAWQLFYYLLLSLWVKLSWNISLLEICELLGLLVNTLTADGKYFLCISENIPQPHSDRTI